jgi:hypothetical protein
MSKETQPERQLLVVPHHGVARQQVQAIIEKAGGTIVKSTGDGEYNLVSAKDDDQLQKCFETLSKSGEMKIVQFNQAYRAVN